MMEVTKIILCSVGSLAVLFLLTHLIGNKQISQLNLFDYINGITIGSIAAEMATSLENDFWKPLLAMIVYALATCGIDLAACKSIRLRRFFEGRAIVLFEHGKLSRNGFRTARINLCEFLALCRSNGFFTLNDLETVIMEANGRLSFLPTATARPANPADFSFVPSPAAPEVPVIMDGTVLDGNLAEAGMNAQWLDKQLDAQNVRRAEVFLALITADGTLQVYKKETTHAKRSRFQ